MITKASVCLFCGGKVVYVTTSTFGLWRHSPESDATRGHDANTYVDYGRVETVNEY